MKPQPQKQNTARSCLHNNTNYSGSVAEPFPQPACDEEPRTVANDDVNVEQPTDVAREYLDAAHFSGAELEDESTSQPGQEGDRQRTETENVGSDHLSTSPGEFRRGNVYTSPAESQSSSKMRFTEPAQSDTDTALEATRTRKRSRPSTGAVTLPTTTLPRNGLVAQRRNRGRRGRRERL